MSSARQTLMDEQVVESSAFPHFSSRGFPLILPHDGRDCIHTGWRNYSNRCFQIVKLMMAQPDPRFQFQHEPCDQFKHRSLNASAVYEPSYCTSRDPRFSCGRRIREKANEKQEKKEYKPRDESSSRLPRVDRLANGKRIPEN